MIQNRLIQVFMLLIITSSCKVDRTEQNNYPREFKLEIKSNPEPSDWDEYIESVDFIPLETTSEVIMSEIHKIIIKNNRIYIQCTKRKGVFIFDLEGKFINNICLLGKAPFQVNYLFDFSVSPDGIIHALDNGKLLTFDSNGNPLKETFFVTHAYDIGQATNICVHNADSIYLWHAGQGNEKRFHLTRAQTNGTIHEFRIPYSIFSFAAARFVQCGNEWAITPPSLNDTIYSIFNGKIEKKFILNILDNDRNIPALIPESSQDFFVSDQFSTYLAKHELSQVYGDIVYNSKYLFVNMHNLKRGIFKRCMINVQTGQVNYFDYPQEPENLFYPRKLYMADKNKFVSSLHAYQVIQLITENRTYCSFLSDPQRIKHLEKLNKVKETDNPVLMMITFKH